MRSVSSQRRPTRSAAPPRRASALRLSPRTLLRVWLGLLWITTFGALGWGLRALEPRARTLQPHQLRLVWVDRPNWLQQDSKFAFILEDRNIGLGGVIQPELFADPYAPDLATRIRERLTDPDDRRTSWISQLHRVRLRPDGQIRIRADFREPRAVILSGGEAFAVDEQAARLNLKCAETEIDRGQWFVIRGVRAGVPAYGQAWPGDDVAAAMKLVDFLLAAEREDRLPFRRSLRSIDVSRFAAERGRLYLETIDVGSPIQWGFAPGQEFEMEASAERKLESLRSFYSKAGQLPSGGVILFDREGKIDRLRTER